ncbi:hypothetical protein [Streptomyces sp. NPDC091259]|uniref:hypothetical protein n=1 Tax=Streptomyces sp. NPDC091259 TaxID=3365976 RepID=UPI0037FE59C8
MSRIDRIKRRVPSVAAVCGLVAGAVFGGAGAASATDPADAPPGYAGPFSSCKGSPVTRMPLADRVGYIQVWYDGAGSGTYCAMTFDNRAGSHNMEIRVRRYVWQTSWYDRGSYSTYAGGVYVSGANTYCAEITGWVEVNGTRYGGGGRVGCDD